MFVKIYNISFKRFLCIERPLKNDLSIENKGFSFDTKIIETYAGFKLTNFIFI